MKIRAVDWIILGAATFTYGMFMLAVERGDFNTWKDRMRERVARDQSWVTQLKEREHTADPLTVPDPETVVESSD